MNSLINLALLLWTLDSHQSFIISSYFEDVKIIFSIYEVLHGTVLVRHGHHAGKILEKGEKIKEMELIKTFSSPGNLLQSLHELFRDPRERGQF